MSPGGADWILLEIIPYEFIEYDVTWKDWRPNRSAPPELFGLRTYESDAKARSKAQAILRRAASFLGLSEPPDVPQGVTFEHRGHYHTPAGTRTWTERLRVDGGRAEFDVDFENQGEDYVAKYVPGEGTTYGDGGKLPDHRSFELAYIYQVPTIATLVARALNDEGIAFLKPGTEGETESVIIGLESGHVVELFVASDGRPVAYRRWILTWFGTDMVRDDIVNWQTVDGLKVIDEWRARRADGD